MERFIKEYANYVKRDRIYFPKVERMAFEEQVDKLLKLRERGLISTGETMKELTKMAYPAMF